MAFTNTDQQFPASGAPVQSRRWRDVIKVHPAAELFPLLSEAELPELVEDIRQHGLHHPVLFWVPGAPRATAAEDFGDISLLDGRNRLDAVEAVGLDPLTPSWLRYHCIFETSGIDPYEYVISANIHRRHLTSAQKQELIENVLRERPERSDRQIAELTKVDHKTVGKIRADLQANGEIPHKERIEASGRKARGRMPRAIEALRDGAKKQGVSLDKYIEMTIADHPPERSGANSASATGSVFYQRNPDADLDPDITAAIELKTSLPALPRSRSLTPVTPRVNGVPPAQNPVSAKVRKREEAIAAIVGHLHHDPTMFLSDVATIMADDQARLARVSIFNRRSALTKIAHALGLRIAADAWKGELRWRNSPPAALWRSSPTRRGPIPGRSRCELDRCRDRRLWRQAPAASQIAPLGALSHCGGDDAGLCQRRVALRDGRQRPEAHGRPQGRRWLAMPSKQREKADGNGTVWDDILEFRDKPTRERFQDMILEVLRREHPEAFAGEPER